MTGVVSSRKCCSNCTPQFSYPCFAQFLEQVTQITRTTIVLALAEQPGKQRQVIRSDEVDKAPFTAELEQVNSQHQGQHLAVADFRLCAKLY